MALAGVAIIALAIVGYKLVKKRGLRMQNALPETNEQETKEEVPVTQDTNTTGPEVKSALFDF